MGLLDSVIEAAKQQYQTTKRGFGLLASNPQQFAQEATTRYFPTKEEEAQFAQAQAAGGDYTQTPYYQKVMNLSQFQGSIKPTGLINAPQQAALDLAQQNAALPVKQGGLGLPPDNTPLDRAKAMGFDTDVYHGTTNDFDKFAGRLPTYATEEPRIADIYANATGRHMSLTKPINAGPNIIPLKLAGKEFSVSDLGEGGGGWFSDNLAQALGIPRTRNLINELPNYGIDRLKVTDMLDLGGVQTQHMIPSGSDNIRSRFAAFDPFRRTAATAVAMGVAAPDLLAAGVPLSLLGTAQKTVNLPEKKKKSKK